MCEREGVEDGQREYEKERRGGGEGEITDTPTRVPATFHRLQQKVEKSPNDPRSYRAIQLPSGMKVR